MTDLDPYRLPTTVAPSHYDLELVPDLEAATFTGRVAIAIEASEPVTEVVLNAIDLDITEAVVEASSIAQTAFVALDEETQRAHLHLEDPIEGEATLTLRFRGELNDKLRGFYRSTFTGPDGVAHTIATTQFEATDARRAFPCWDEPDRKATFAVTLVVDDGLLAVSNGAEVSREPAGDGKVRVRYSETIPMSTYLVAFVVGPLEATDAVDVDGTPLRVVHPPGKGHLTAFALEAGAHSLRLFTDYFGQPYPADKLDLIAIPDFAFGAMENLGCVTFRETALLVDPAKATQGELQRVSDVVHHEIAHMWFGDLVTMRWWNGIWLNEAFATFMETGGTDRFRPEWDRWTSYALERSAAFDTDSLASTRPIEFEVVSPEDAEGMFDVLTYEKGGSVVRMLEQYLGEDRFREGIRRYMATHRLGNTETTDLWDAIEAATDEPARRMMDSWIFQGGHPLISAALADGALRLDQTPMRFTTGAGAAEPVDATWVVPVLARELDGGRADHRVLLDGGGAEVAVGEGTGAVLVNAGGSGFYRVRYEPELLAAILASVGELSAVERYALVDDTWAAVLAGQSTASDVLAVARALAAAGESDLSVWQRIVGVLHGLDRIAGEADRPALAATVQALVAPALARLGDEPAPDEPDRTKALRGSLLATLGVLSPDPAVVSRAEDLHRRAVAGEAVDPELLRAAIAILARQGGEARWDEFWDLSKQATNPQDVLRYLGALTEFPEPALLTRFLERCLTDDVRTQDAPYLIGSALGNRHNSALAWRFVRDHWAEVNGRFPSNSIPRLVGGIRGIADPAVATDVRAFLAEHPVPQGAKTVTQHVERMGVTVALAEREGPGLATALAG